MNLLLAARLLGWLLVALGGFGLVPIAAAILYGDPLGPYLAAFAAPVLIGLPIGLGIRPTSLRIRPRDGFLIVSLAWIVASVAGALPYVTTGALGLVDALFESVSGFTTTGSTVLPFIEGQPRPLLLWRSLTQWLGGMGIVVFTVALMPLLGIGGMSLFRAEMTGPVNEKIRPRVAATARRLWFVYVGLTSAEWLALILAGMSPYEALCHSFSTLSTGGFSPRDGSLGAYDSNAIQWIVMVFMFLGGVNFVLHYRALTGRPREVLRDSELRYYAGLTAAATFAFLLIVWRSGLYDGDLVRIAAFQAISLLTGTGFATVHFDLWPALGQLIILQLMLLGAMAGSTCGALKSLRVLLGLRALQASFSLAGHRNAVRSGIRFGGKVVSSEVLSGVWTFFAAYFLLVAVAAAVVAAAGYDLVTSISCGISAVGNVGPALGAAGPFDGFAGFPAPVKLVLALCMIAGRLELFTLLVLFMPSFWRR